MRLHFDEDLIEGVVWRCANGERAGISPLTTSRFRLERERLYRVLDPDERQTAFARLHAEWFREWQLEQALMRIVRQYALLPTNLANLAFRRARSRAEEGAELFVQEADAAEPGGTNRSQARTAVVALLPERFASDARLAELMHHELMHLQDMVDPAFGYQKTLRLTVRTPAQERLARDRYRLLWDITIDGRLSARGLGCSTPIERHRAGFDRAYGFQEADWRELVFAELWQGRTPTHARLAELAVNPRGREQDDAPLPGGPCPLCTFPTFDWRDASTLEAGVRVRIHAEFPDWRLEHGLCGRCAEAYEVIEAAAAMGEPCGS